MRVFCSSKVDADVGFHGFGGKASLITTSLSSLAKFRRTRIVILESANAFVFVQQP